METPSLHLLVVDPDETLLFAIRQVLEDEGHRVTTFDDGHRALEWLYEQGLPDMVLLGMRLPTMSGWTFWSRMRFLRGADRLPVVVMSDDSSIRGRIFEVGASGFLARPFSIEQLFDAIEHAVRYPRAGGAPSPAGRPDL